MNRRTRAGHDAQAGRLVRVVAYGLLLFVAVAIIHEFVPGLCAASDAQGDECPFCALIYTLVIAVAAFLCLLRASSVRANLASADTIAPPASRRSGLRPPRTPTFFDPCSLNSVQTTTLMSEQAAWSRLFS